MTDNATMGKISHNLFGAFVYNTLGIPVVAAIFDERDYPCVEITKCETVGPIW